jgi:hypothetical protein
MRLSQVRSVDDLLRTLRGRVEQLCAWLRRTSLSAVHRGVLSAVAVKTIEFRDAVTELLAVGACGRGAEDKDPFATPFEWTSRLRFSVVVRSPHRCLCVVVFFTRAKLSGCVLLMLSSPKHALIARAVYCLLFLQQQSAGPLSSGSTSRSSSPTSSDGAPVLSVDTHTRLDVAVDCCDARLPYGFEFLGSSSHGGPHRLYLPMPTQRARVSAFQGLVAGFGVAVLGGSSTGKTETMRHLAGALGRGIMHVDCSSMTTPITVTNALTACFAGYGLQSAVVV